MYKINPYRPHHTLLYILFAEYYTDSVVTTSDSNDFIPVPNDPLTVSNRQICWNQTDDSGDNVLREIQITINDDNPGLCESYEMFNVYLTNVVGGTLGKQSVARVKIIDDDSKI